MGEVWWSRFRKSYSGPAEIVSFSRSGFSRSNKHGAFLHVVSTVYFDVIFLWAITVADFPPLEIYKNLGLPLSTITYKQYEISFLLKYTQRFLYLNLIWMGTIIYKKTLYWKKYENYWITCCTHMTSHGIQ